MLPGKVVVSLSLQLFKEEWMWYRNMIYWAILMAGAWLYQMIFDVFSYFNDSMIFSPACGEVQPQVRGDAGSHPHENQLGRK